MSVRKIRQSWWVDFRFNFTRYRKRSPQNTRGGAEAYEVCLRHELSIHGSLNAYVKVEAKPTFAEFSERWFSSYVEVNNKPSECRSKKYILSASLNPFFGHQRLNEITTADIEAYKGEQLKRGNCNKTVNNRLAVLRKCLTTAVEWSVIESIPRFRQLKAAPPAFRFLEEHEVERIIQACANDMERILVFTAARTGLRFSELSALEWQDVDFGRRTVTIRRANVGGHIGTPKNGRIRYVPLTNDVIEKLKTLNRDSDIIFHRAGKRLIYWPSLCFLQRACKRANIEPIGWHTLRHTFASQLASKGASMQAIKDLLGHSTLTMTLRYAHLAPETLRDTIELLEPQQSSKPWATGGQRDIPTAPINLETLFATAFNPPLNHTKKPQSS
jgi:integrase